MPAAPANSIFILACSPISSSVVIMASVQASPIAARSAGASMGT